MATIRNNLQYLAVRSELNALEKQCEFFPEGLISAPVLTEILKPVQVNSGSSDSQTITAIRGVRRILHHELSEALQRRAQHFEVRGKSITDRQNCQQYALVLKQFKALSTEIQGASTVASAELLVRELTRLWLIGSGVYRSFDPASAALAMRYGRFSGFPYTDERYLQHKEVCRCR